jgi:hypothetical protein
MLKHDVKPKILLIFVVCGLVAFFYWSHQVYDEIILTVTSAPSLGSSPLFKASYVPSTGVVARSGNNIPSPKTPQAVQKRSVTISPVLLPESAVLPEGRQGAAGMAANVVPTEAEALAVIRTENEKRQAASAAVADRKKQIAKVHEAIINSQWLAVADKEKPVAAPLLDPPPAIADKLKSGQLIGH